MQRDLLLAYKNYICHTTMMHYSLLQKVVAQVLILFGNDFCFHVRKTVSYSSDEFSIVSVLYCHQEVYSKYIKNCCLITRQARVFPNIQTSIFLIFYIHANTFYVFIYFFILLLKTSVLLSSSLTKEFSKKK